MSDPHGQCCAIKEVLPHQFSPAMAELIWDGKYDEHGNKRAPVRIELPFQTVETVNESAQDRQRTLELSASGADPEWRNRLIWGDKKYVLPSLLPEFASKVDLIYSGSSSSERSAHS